jgi:MoxR-like ATPase
MTKKSWHIFKGTNKRRSKSPRIPDPPRWRRFQDSSRRNAQAAEAKKYWQRLQDVPSRDRDQERGETFQIRGDQDRVVDAVNAALYLRRPLLVTGKPGSGKTSLAYAIAYELNLGPVLLWPITARSTLQDGLYRYDAIARLQDAQLAQYHAQQGNLAEPTAENQEELLDPYRNIGNYIQLGPLGTAFIPSPHPRVLLIDEIDKSDINLPNDLLNLLEEGEFEIPELVRLAKHRSDAVSVRTADKGLDFPLSDGNVRCQSFPLIVMTSNGERDFPPAFLRRCLQVTMPKPKKDDLIKIVKAHLGEVVTQEIEKLVEDFAEHANTQVLQETATNQLLHAVFLRIEHKVDRDDLFKILLPALTNTDTDANPSP